MTKEEIEKLINSKKFSTAIRCYGKDKLRDLITEIYLDGMSKGYELAMFRLELLNSMPSTAGDKYLDENLGKIRDIINLCEMYEKCDE
ncbi:MAG: hypothetical protein IJP84_12010 [Lachnospiraceae bacterium]|nr:hypothetical protein [Lachnospiraceae bacterium]